MANNNNQTSSQGRGVKITVTVVVLFILAVIAMFVYRVQQPRIMTVAEMKINGAYILDTPRKIGEFNLIDQTGSPFTNDRFEGVWTLVFFGFTNCPDVCPTTMAFLSELVQSLEGTEAEDTRVVMVSVDPARDTAEVLAQYVP